MIEKGRRFSKEEVRGRKIKKVHSLSELRVKAEKDPWYEKLAMSAARNLGGDPKDLASAMKWLELNAQETDERGVVKEVNFCRDLVS